MDRGRRAVAAGAALLAAAGLAVGCTDRTIVKSQSPTATASTVVPAAHDDATGFLGNNETAAPAVPEIAVKTGPRHDNTPILPRAVISQEDSQVILFLPHGNGELKMNGKCVVVEYLLPDEPHIRPFTLVTANPTGTPATGEHRTYVEVQDGKPVLITDRYRHGVLSRSRLYEHGDRLGGHLPVSVVEWLMSIPDECPSDWLWIDG